MVGKYISLAEQKYNKSIMFFSGRELIHYQRFLFILLLSLNFLQNQIPLSFIPMNESCKLIGKTPKNVKKAQLWACGDAQGTPEGESSCLTINNG